MVVYTFNGIEAISGNEPTEAVLNIRLESQIGGIFEEGKTVENYTNIVCRYY